MEYFMEQYRKVDEPVYLFDAPSTLGKSKRKSYIIDKDSASKIMEYLEKKNISAYVFFFTLINTYFSRIKNNAEKFYLGTIILNRTTQAQRNTAGLFVNTVPYLSEIESKESFLFNLKRLEENTFGLLRHQKFNYNEMLSEIKANSLFDVIFSYQNNIIYGDYSLSTWYHNGMQNESLQIHIDDRDSAGVYRIHYDYQISKFTEYDVEKMHQRLTTLICDVINNDDKPLCELNLSTAEEKEKVLNEFNNTRAEYSKDKCIHELFEEQVERTPDKIALVASDKKVTYRELNEEANRIANNLIEKGIGKGDIVGLMLPRKSYLLSALLGILKTGAAYLPIDSELPKERIEYMCKDTNARLVVSMDNIDSLLESENICNPKVDMTNESLCYCIYTSGSTGQPKGVMARHRNVVNYISKNEHNIFGKIIKEDFEAIVSISTCSFDIFVTETIATLVNGLRVVLADEQECRNQYALNRLLTREKGQFLQTTPTKLKALTKEPGQREFLRSVKAILLGGEAMEWSYLNELKALTDAKIYNIYGVTEVPIWSAFVDTDTFKDEITIGHGIANTEMYIVDKYVNPTPVGVMGELCRCSL
jgi:non-ribosomal peptide synthetase component F